MNEMECARQFIYDKLAADGTLTALIGSSLPRIYPGMAEQGEAFPMIQIRWQGQVGGGDTRTLNYERVWTRMRFLVVGIVDIRSYLDPLATIADKIDDLLERQTGSNSLGTVKHCVREAPYAKQYPEDGIIYTEQGAYFELAVIGT
jgi:hypothetical protein